MKMTLLSLFLIGSISAQASVSSVTQDLTVKSILVRVGMGGACTTDLSLMPLAGGQLELAYDNAMASLKVQDLTDKAWTKMKPEQCLKSCTCSALSRIYEKYPEDLKKKISNKKVEEALAKMTDQDYMRCMKSYKNFCQRKDVTDFIKSLKAAQ